MKMLALDTSHCLYISWCLTDFSSSFPFACLAVTEDKCLAFHPTIPVLSVRTTELEFSCVF